MRFLGMMSRAMGVKMWALLSPAQESTHAAHLVAAETLRSAPSMCNSRCERDRYEVVSLLPLGSLSGSLGGGIGRGGTEVSRASEA